jgi:hypothetical protein
MIDLTGVFVRLNIPCSPFPVLVDNEMQDTKNIAVVHGIWNHYTTRGLGTKPSLWVAVACFLTCIAMGDDDDPNIIIPLTDDPLNWDGPGSKDTLFVYVQWVSEDHMVIMGADTMRYCVDAFENEQ